ncbi:MAG TPA: alkaline phosphatase family protein [Rhizomicrobium sp.]|nr:alkaline phosphatase family protein [Rhizomicrobium sp.]
MKLSRFGRRLAFAGLMALAALPASAAPRNIVIFVADGLRSESVTKETAPTMYAIRKMGVNFTNSHALYPTVTTANASAIATGHYLGDTGDYGNVLFTGFPVVAKNNSNVVFLEDDGVLKEMKAHYGEDYLGQQSLLAAARANGMVTAVVGKTGPVAIQDIDALAGTGGIVLDDSTGKTNSDGTPMFAAPLDPALAAQIKAATSLDHAPDTSVPNLAQQNYMVTATTGAVLPYLKAQGKPFVLLFWSRDPDASQHAAPDSIGALAPGINGDTDKAAIANADTDLKTILDAVGTLGLSDNTDVFVTADHGFSTIGKGDPDNAGGMGAPSHPAGFLAIDVAKWLGNRKLFDPDANNGELDYASGVHPARGNGLIGNTPEAPMAIVAANGGSDFIYLPEPATRLRAKRIFDQLIQQPYVGAVFINDALMKEHAQDFAGALPMSAINLIGSSHVPQPAIVVGFRSFVAKDCKLSAQLCAVEMSDTPLQTGQGMHGSFSRADTHNFMAAIGPDFKARFNDPAPVSNADLAPTIAHVLGFALPVKGRLAGRVATEALEGGKPVTVTHGWQSAAPGVGGLKTVLVYQRVGGTRYFDAAGIAGRTMGLSAH